MKIAMNDACSSGELAASGQQSRITAKEIDTALENATHPVSHEIPVLRRFEGLLADMELFTNCAFRRYGELLTDDDPQTFSYVQAAVLRKCFDVRIRPGTRLEKIFVYFREPEVNHSRIVAPWNAIAHQNWCRQADLEPDFDLGPFKELVPRLKAAFV